MAGKKTHDPETGTVESYGGKWERLCPTKLYHKRD
jgi:hypothetical protein